MSTRTGTQRTSRARWTIDEAQEWYAARDWIVGCNYIPKTAVNQLEMWQADTFDPETIDQEMGWARDVGFNAARVFLHDLLWSTDKSGFVHRLDDFLGIASRHGISVMFVLLDGVWDPMPRAGQQRSPRPRIHNSGWVQSPGAEALGDPSHDSALVDYVRGIVHYFRDDPRILAWDLFNEPDNPNRGTYGDLELKNKAELAEALLRKAFEWGREASPSQPLTAGVWKGGVTGEDVPAINRLMLHESDVISFTATTAPSRW